MADSTRLQQLFTFLDNTPNDPFVLFAIAKEHEKLKNLEQALEYYLKLEEVDANYVGTYYHLGKLYEQQGAIDQAFATYKKGMQVARQQGDQHSLSELAGAKLNLGDEEE